jgi:hypothetical protein
MSGSAAAPAAPTPCQNHDIMAVVAVEDDT